MASIEFIQKRIAGKEKELAKLNKKLERIHKAEATSWEVNPYYYSEHDLKLCLKDIEAAQKSLEDYKTQLISETEKANSRDVKIIVEFLEGWKERTRRFYINSFPRYLEALKEYQQKNKEHYDWWNHGGFKDPNKKEIDREYNEYCNNFKATWSFITMYTKREQNKETFKFEYIFDLEALNKELEQEANRKYDFIIERTNRIVGQITDASNLKIGAKADLNGYIIGTKGTAKVQTIGAGGYNIQCFHFRTLINEMK